MGSEFGFPLLISLEVRTSFPRNTHNVHSAPRGRFRAWNAWGMVRLLEGREVQTHEDRRVSSRGAVW